MSATIKTSAYTRCDTCDVAQHGFTLIELMVAMALGLLLSIGLVTVFGAASKNNNVQQKMAAMQENGRYAILRMNDDLRRAFHQLSNASGYTALATGSNGAVTLSVAPDVYTASIAFPSGTVGTPTNWIATTSHWPLSPAYFLSGWSSTTAPSYLPTVSTNTDQKRVKGADVVGMRYLDSEGWSSTNGELAITCNGANLVSIVLTPATGTYPGAASNFVAGDLAFLASSSGDESIFPVALAGTTLTPNTAKLIHASDQVKCPGSGEVKLFNFSRDFITVTYWLKLSADPQLAGRFIPTLVRTQADNAGNSTSNEIVQGVEQMNFLYGVQKQDGSVQYVDSVYMNTAANNSKTTCTPPPATFFNRNFFTAANVPVYEANCLWRSVKSVEAHLLVDSINNLYTLTSDEMAYQYNGSGTPMPPASQTTIMPSGLPAGAMMRREFVTQVSVRNNNN